MGKCGWRGGAPYRRRGQECTRTCARCHMYHMLVCPLGPKGLALSFTSVLFSLALFLVSSDKACFIPMGLPASGEDSR